MVEGCKDDKGGVDEICKMTKLVPFVGEMTNDILKQYNIPDVLFLCCAGCLHYRILRVDFFKKFDSKFMTGLQ